MSTRKSLLTALPAAALAFAGGMTLDAARPVVPLVPAALAQAANPCAPAALSNPCAPAALSNPCAPAALSNPCAPAAKALPMKAGLTEGAANPYDVEAKWPEAPYGDVMPDVVPNYLRAAPHVGTGGLPKDGSFTALKDLGFKTIINLNTKEEGAETEGQAATAAGLEYVSIEVPTKAPTAEQVAELAKIIEDPERYPVLLHCHSANRVGAMWALYRASAGVPAEIAIQEGRTVGLKPSREEAVREQLGLPVKG